MAEYIIDKIAYDGNVYKLQDNQSGYITTETDPVFSASPAAGISATDISNWNGKVSDDKTWNGVTLEKAEAYNATIYIPFVNETSDTTAYYIMASSTPLTHRVPLYDGSSHLKSTTPSANDNSTKVATTAYVDGAIPSISLNGSSTTSASFYAPTTAGTDGYYLKSNGTGAPTWAAIPGGVIVTLNGTVSATPSFYAPTTAGTSGQVLTSNGSGAPTWAAATGGTSAQIIRWTES